MTRENQTPQPATKRADRLDFLPGMAEVALRARWVLYGGGEGLPLVGDTDRAMALLLAGVPVTRDAWQDNKSWLERHPHGLTLDGVRIGVHGQQHMFSHAVLLSGNDILADDWHIYAASKTQEG